MPSARFALVATLVVCLPLFAQSNEVVIGFSPAEYSVLEGSQVTLTVVRGGNLDAAVSADVAIHALGPITPARTAVHFAAGETSKSLTFTADDDAVYRGNYVAGAQLQNAPAGVRFDPSLARIEVMENEPRPSLIISDPVAREGDGYATFELRLDGAIAQPRSVRVRTQDETATAGADYQALDQLVSIPNSGVGVLVNVLTYNDGVSEPDETFLLTVDSFGIPDFAMPRPYGRATIRSSFPQLLLGTETELGGGLDGGVTFGGPAPSAGAITISTDPTILRAPSSVEFAAGATGVSFVIEPLAPGRATVRVTLPAFLGGEVFERDVQVVEPLFPQLDPPSLTMSVGDTAEVRLSLFPPSAAPVQVSLKTTGGLEAPVTAMIPPAGVVLIPVRATAAGRATLTALTSQVHGSRSDIVNVTINAAPARPEIRSVTPASGSRAGGTEVQITGSLLEPGCTVRFGSVLATHVTVTSTTIAAITPPHVPGTVGVTLVCGTREQTLASAFTYLAAVPSIQSMTPSSGTTRGGTWTRIEGMHFLDSCAVRFDGVPATDVRLESAGTLLAVTPPHAAGSVPVHVACESGTAVFNFTYAGNDDAAPAILSLSASEAAPGEAIRLRGSGFHPADAITIGNARAAILDSAPDAHVIRVPELPPGTYSITLTDPSSRVTTTGPVFRITAAVVPEVASARLSGAELHLEGRGFRPALTFLLGDRKLRVVTMSFERVVLRVPPSLGSGTHALTIRDVDGVVASGPDVTLAPRLTVVDVTPGCAAFDEHPVITLRGSGFTAGVRVAFGSVLADDVTFVDDNTLRVVAPYGQVGTQPITVTTPGGTTATLTNGFRFFGQGPSPGCHRQGGIR